MKSSTASCATNTEKPPRSRSRTVWKTQTCASIPTTTTCLRPVPRTWPAIGLDAPQENSILLIGSCGRSSRSEATVRPRPFGYCSVAITGISRRRAARISTAAFFSSSASGAFGIAAASFSCTSITISSASARSSASEEAVASDRIALRAAGCGRLRVEDDVHAGDRSRCQRAFQRRPDLRRLGHVLAVSTQRFHDLVVAGRSELRRRRLLRPEQLYLWKPDLAPGGVVSDHHHHGQLEAERGLVVHAIEAEGAVALDHEHRPVRMQELRGDGERRAHPEAPQRPWVEPAPGLSQADHLGRDRHPVPSIGHEHALSRRPGDGVQLLGETEMVDGHRVRPLVLRLPGGLRPLLLAQAAQPGSARAALRGGRGELLEDAAGIAHDPEVDRTVAADLRPIAVT